MSTSDRWIPDRAPVSWGGWSRPALPVVVVSVLLCLGAANIASRAAFREVEDGVLWATRSEGVVAADIADGTPAAAVGIERGDLLLAINDRPIEDPSDVVAILHGANRGETLRYTVLRLGSRDVIDVRVAPIPGGPGILYFLLAGVGTFTLLVGGAVRLRRPRDPATLHFLWLSVAFFGVFTFSFSGRLDRLDWVFFWADEVSILALPPLFLHFTLVFPERSTRLNSTRFGRIVEIANYAPAIILGLTRVMSLTGATTDAARFVRVSTALDRLAFLYLAVCFIGGLIVLTRALRHVRTVTARRQLRWIAWGTAFGAGPFAFGYALPYALGVAPSLPMQLSAIPLSLIPLAYASAIVRYRLMDVEVIVKRALVYAAVLSAVVAMYVVLLKVVQRMFVQGSAGHEWVIAFLATLVAVLLAPPVKDFVQTTLDRAFYRDRYDYRRALVGLRPRSEQRSRPGPLERPSRLPGRRDARGRLHGAAGRERVGPELGGDARLRVPGGAAGAAEAFRHRPPSGRRAMRWRSTIPPRSAGSPPRRSSSGATPACTTSCRAFRRPVPRPCSRWAASIPASRSTARTWRCWPPSRRRWPPRSRTRGSTGSSR